MADAIRVLDPIVGFLKKMEADTTRLSDVHPLWRQMEATLTELRDAGCAFTEMVLTLLVISLGCIFGIFLIFLIFRNGIIFNMYSFVRRH